MIEDKDQLIDIYNVWYKPFWHQKWFSFVIVVCMILLITFFIYLLYKKYIKKTVSVDHALIAVSGLDALKNIQIITEHDSKDCYFSLSLIIKKYLASRYNVIFTQLTDKEIIQHAEIYMTDENVHMLQKILQGMVFVKFEHEVAMNEKIEKDIQLIKDFIKNTRLQRDMKEV